MKDICVITGGGSGIGLATAKLMSDYNSIIISGRNKEKLMNAAAEIEKYGINVDIFSCDISKESDVVSLCEFALEKGEISTVINAAGISPSMGNIETLFDINVRGTININKTFLEKMKTSSCIVNIASMSAYLLPFLSVEDGITRKDYLLSLTDVDAFKSKTLETLSSLPNQMQEKTAYSMTKDFVIWYSSQCACEYGKSGIRVLSVSPGTFETPMSKLEGDQSTSYALNGALGRIGTLKEISELIEFCTSEKASYITGTDILCDGGCIAAIRRSFENRQK